MAQGIVRLYPRTWRLRYGREIRTLLQDRPPGVAGCIDLVRGCAAEWRRTLTDPVAFPFLSAIPYTLFQTAVWMGAAFGLPWFAGFAGGLLRELAASPATFAGSAAAGVGVSTAVMLRFLVAVRSPSARYRVGVWEARCWVAGLIVVFTVEEWSSVRGRTDDAIRMATAVWFLVMSSRQVGLMLATRGALQTARLDEHRMALRLQAAEEYGAAAAAPLAGAGAEAAGADLVAVRARIRRHAANLRRMHPLVLLGLSAP
jgi:hypothetical protein